jgi:hypothetical protein
MPRRRRRVTRKREFADVCHHSSDAHTHQRRRQSHKSKQ